MAEEAFYLNKAQRRQLRANAKRTQPLPPAPAGGGKAPYQAKPLPSDRPYSRTKPKQTAEPAQKQESIASAMVTAPIPAPSIRPRRAHQRREPLSDGLSRIQRAQAESKSQKQGRRLHLPTSRRFYALASIPL